MAGWGDGAWGDLYYGGERAGATYLAPGVTTLPAGTTTYTAETVVPYGATLKFPPASTATLVMDNKNLIIYGTHEMHPASASVVHTVRFTNVNEAAFVGGPFNGLGTMVPSTTDIGLWVVETGILDAIGTPKAGWNRTGDDATWVVGDDIRKTPWASLDYTTYATHPKAGTLQTVSPGNGVTYTQEAFNLTRNVRFEGTAGHRAHVIIITPSVTQVVKYAVISQMGPRKSVGGLLQGVHDRLGGVHLQHLGDSPSTLIEGVVVRDAGNQAFTSSDSHYTTFRDCVAYNTTDDQFVPTSVDIQGINEPSQNSKGVTFDHCMAAAAQVPEQEGGQNLAGFRLGGVVSGTITDCVAVGNTGFAAASGFFWREDSGAVWTNSNCVAHNNGSRAMGAFVYQQNALGHETHGMVLFRNGNGGIYNGFVNNFHHENLASFQNAGTVGDRGGADFVGLGGNSNVAPNYHQVVQDGWFGDSDIAETHINVGGTAVWRNNRLGSIRIDELPEGAFPNGTNFHHQNYDFVENDLQEPDQFCDLVHPHAGSHHLEWLYSSASPDGIASRYRVQRTDGTAWQIQLDAGSYSYWTPATIAGFAFAVPAQTLPDAVIGVSYSYTLTKTFGGSSVTWALASMSGPLPTGLSLSSAGVISGTTSAIGSYPITVQATDESTEHARRSFTLTVQGPVVVGGWGDMSWGTGRWSGDRVGATYLSGTTTLSGGTTTWTDERVVPIGATLRFDPAASSTTLVMDNKNLIIYGVLDMKQPDPAKTMRLQITNVVEQSYVGAPNPNNFNNMGSMVPSLTDIGIWCMETGLFDVVGAVKVGWNRTGSDPTWLPGDEIKTSPWAPFDYTSYDHFFRNGVLGHWPLPFNPLTDTLQSFVGPNGLTYTQEAFNLTRNITIGGTSGHRVHCLIMTPGLTQVVKYCTFQHMGPRFVNADGTTQLRRGRWAGIHFHHLMDSVGSLAEGIVVRDGSGHSMVAHDSNDVTFRDCVTYHTIDDVFWWDSEMVVKPGVINPKANSDYMLAPDQASDNALYDHCFSAWCYMLPGEEMSSLVAFTANANSGDFNNCCAVGNMGTSTAAGFTWPETAGGIWTGRGNVSHNNSARGVYIWHNNGSHHEVFDMTAFRNGQGGITNGAYTQNYHHADEVAFANVGTGMPDFNAHADASNYASPNWHQVVQDGWYGDMGIKYHVANPPDSNTAIYRNNHLGHVKIDEWRSPGGNNFMHGNFDFVENDCQEPEDFCDLAHPHAGNHQCTFMMNGYRPEAPKPAIGDLTPSVYRVQRLDGTAFRLQQVATPGVTSVTEFTAVTIPAFAFAVPTQSLNQATQGQPYSDSLVYSPGTGNSTTLPVTWALRPGSGPLPPGLSLSAAGVISGTPTGSGTYPITVQAVDASTQRARRTISLVVGSSGVATVTPGFINGSGVLFAPSVNQVALPPPSITTVALGLAEVGAAYSFQMVATSGKQPYVWSIVSGTLPAGISFSASGAFSGVPTTDETRSLGIRVTDALGKFDTVTLPLQVVPTVSVSSGALPDATVGRAYSYTFIAQDGIGPYTFAASDIATLPEGMTITSAGVLSGTPIFARTYQFSVIVVDSVGMFASGPLTLAVGIPLHRVGRALALRGAPRYVSAR